MNGTLKITFAVAGLILLATILCWLIFFFNLAVIGIFHVHNVDLSVPAIFSVFTTGLVLIFLDREVRTAEREQQKEEK